MLDKAIAFLQNRILTDQFNGEIPEPVIVGSIFNEKGEPLIGAGLVGLMIINIDEERIFKAQLQQQKRNGCQKKTVPYKKHCMSFSFEFEDHHHFDKRDNHSI